MRLSIFMLVGSLAIVPASAAVKSYDMGEAGVLALDLPQGWTLTRHGADVAGGSQFRIVPPAGTQLELLLTPSPAPRGGDAASTVRPRVEGLVRALQSSAVEAALPLRALDGTAAHGYFISATDKTVLKPTATSFKYVDQGFVALGPIHLKFTVLTNLAEGAVRAQARAIVGEARISPPSAPPAPSQSASGTVELAVPGESWALALDLPGFHLDPIESRPDGRGVRVLGKNSETGVVASVYIEPGDPGKSAAEYRENLWRRLQADASADERDEKRSMRGTAAVLEYSIPTIDELPINQKHVNAVLVNAGMWIDVHLSKVRYEAKDEAQFEKILASLKIVGRAEGIASRR